MALEKNLYTSDFLLSFSPYGTLPGGLGDCSMRHPIVEMADWHVTLRGARRLALFHDLDDYQTFYAMLGYACERSGMIPIANCLMSNHFHLSLTGSSGQLTSCMWKLDRQYSGYHNDKYELSGHAFEKEYYREPIPSPFILKRVVRYIHVNPVRAGMVQRLEDYRWSSYVHLLRGPAESLSLSESRFLEAFDPDPAQAKLAYKQFVEKDLRRRQFLPAARSSASEIWQEQFRWFLEFAEESKDRLHPLAIETVAAWWALRSGIPPRAVAKVLGEPDGKRISQICYKLSKRLERDPELAARIKSLGAL